jgi:cutinase
MKGPTSLLAALVVLRTTAAPTLYTRTNIGKFPRLSFLSARQYSGDPFNQLTDGTPCRRVTVIYARGTTQDGNVGDPAAVGPLFFNALAAKIASSSLAVQGVDYSASIVGFLAGGDSDGSNTMRDLVTRVR